MAGGPRACEVNLRSFWGSPVARGAEDDLRLTLHTLGPHTHPEVQPGIVIDGEPENVDERIWDPARRWRAMPRNPLKINENERVGSLRFSLWKPSPLLILLLEASACGFRIFWGKLFSEKMQQFF